MRTIDTYNKLRMCIQNIEEMNKEMKQKEKL